MLQSSKQARTRPCLQLRKDDVYCGS